MEPAEAKTSGMARLLAGARLLGIDLSPRQMAQFEAYRAELLSWNRKFNLTSITEPAEVETKHFLDSLSAFLAFPSGGPKEYGELSVLDVGTGAGFPGLPLKIAFPEMGLTLLETTQKKAAFLRHMAETLMMLDVEIVTARAEDAGRLPEHRERYDIVLARALAPMPVLAELTLPFCRVGGVVIAQKKGDLSSELSDAEAAVVALGGRLGMTVPVALPGLEDGRALVVLQKGTHTRGRFPRKAGLPQKHPLAPMEQPIER